MSDANGVATVQLTTSKAATVTATAGGKNATVAVAVNSAPSVTLAAVTTSPTAGAPFSFTVTPNTGSTPDVTVDFGDNTTQNLGAVSAARTVTHTYSSPGSFIVAARSIDSSTNETASTTLAVTIGARPVATVKLAQGHDHKPRRFRKRVHGGAGRRCGGASCSSIAVDFGDGSSGTIGAVSAAATIAHTYTTAGTYTVKATLTDTGGFTSTASQSVTIGARPVFTVTIAATGLRRLGHRPLSPWRWPSRVPGTPAPVSSVQVTFGDGSSRTSERLAPETLPFSTPIRPRERIRRRQP